MKKSFACIFLLLLSAALQGQPAVARQEGGTAVHNGSLQEAVAGDEAAGPGQGMAAVGILSEQELQDRLLSWESLGSLSLGQYLESFRSFLEVSRPHHEMQPYVLAECLWFQAAVLPRFQEVQRDGSLDRMMELNMEVLPQVQQLVAAFLSQLEEGTVAPHPWSDGVAAFFRELAQNPVAGLRGSLLEFGPLPELAALEDGHVFMPVEGSYRNALLYHGLTDFQRLVSRFDAAMEATAVSPESPSAAPEAPSSPPPEEAAPAAGEGGAGVGSGSAAGGDFVPLPPPVGGIDWGQVVADQALMYLLRHLPSGGRVYSYLLDYHTGETAASRCEDLYLAACRLQEQWGFSLASTLPDFSAAALDAVAEDPFVLYCLPAGDLERLSADLACVGTMAPAYFGRTVSLLHRPAGRGNPAENEGGSL